MYVASYFAAPTVKWTYLSQLSRLHVSPERLTVMMFATVLLSSRYCYNCFFASRVNAGRSGVRRARRGHYR